MSLQAKEQVLKRRLMEEVPQEPITADPREDEEDEDVPEEEDEERGGQARRVVQRAELGGERRQGGTHRPETRSGEIVSCARPGSH
jgi:hypothetical protein